MACGCTKRRAAAQPRTYVKTSGTTTRQVFALVLPSGEEQRFGSRLEADAANARAGYAGVVRVG